MKRVAVVSRLAPFVRSEGAYSLEDNMKLAEVICARLVKDGYAAFAGHAFYPRFLDDTNATERAMGTAAGRAWMATAHVAVIVERYGISSGMADDVEFLRTIGVPRVQWDGKDFDVLLRRLEDVL